MPVNIIPRGISCFVGGISRTVISFAGSDSKLDQSGLIKFTGKLVVRGQAVTPLDALNPVKYPQNWYRGIPVLIYQNSLLHPRGRLYLLKPPKAPHTGDATLELEVGCRFSLMSFKEPDADQSGATFGDSNTRTDILASLMTAAGITGGLPYLPGSLNYPYDKNGGNYLDQCGKLAIAAGYYLRDRIESTALVVEKINFSGFGSSGGTAVIPITLGSDEVEFEPIDGAESACELVRCVGTTYEVGAQGEGSTSIEERFDSSGVLQQRTTRTESWNADTAQKTITTKIELRRDIAIPDSVFAAVGANTAFSPASLLIPSDTITEVSQYEKGQAGKLLSKTTTRVQPDGVSLIKWISGSKSAARAYFTGRLLTATRTSETTVASYQYSAKEEPATITETKKMLKGAITPKKGWSADYNTDAATLSDAGLAVTAWKEVRPKTWENSVTAQKSQGLINPDTELDRTTFPSNITQVAEMIRLVYDAANSIRNESNTGQNQPPAAERRQTLFNTQEVQAVGEAKLPAKGPVQFRDRQITLSFEALNGKGEGAEGETPEQQLERLAKFFGAIKIGRRQSFRLITDLYNYRALRRIRVGNYVLRVDNASFAIGDSKATAGCDLILEGNTTGSITVPVTTTSLTVVGATTVTIEPLTVALSAGATVTIGGVDVVLSEDAPAGTTTLAVEETTEEIGDAESGESELILVDPPYAQVQNMRGGLVIGGSTRAYPYSLEPVVSAMRGGLVIGGKLSPSFTATMRGGLVIGGTINAFTSRAMRGGLVIGGTIHQENRFMNGGLVIGGTMASAVDGPAEILEVQVFALTPSSTDVDPIEYEVMN